MSAGDGDRTKLEERNPYASIQYVMRSMQEQYSHASAVLASTRAWYPTMPPPTRWQRLSRKMRALGRRPFERLRDVLVGWLGCDCDPY